jgi:hypothetical protein
MEDYHIYYSESEDSMVLLFVYYETDTHRNHYFKIFKEEKEFIFFHFSNLKSKLNYSPLDSISSNGKWFCVQTSTTLEFILFEKKRKWNNSYLKKGFSSTILLQEGEIYCFTFHFDLEEFLSSFENVLNYEQRVLVRRI